MSSLLQSMKVFVCWVLRSHEIWGPHFMDFLMFWWFIEWYSTNTRNRFASKPATLDKFISTKTRVKLVDLPKVRCEQSVFSAPRQLMSVDEGREVIVNYIEKIRPVISELLFKFLLHWASWLRLTAPTHAKSSLGWTPAWSKFFKRQFLHSSASFTAKQTRTQTSDAIRSYASICTLRHMSSRLKNEPAIFWDY